MTQWSRKATIIRWSAEIVIVLAAATLIAFFFASGGEADFGFGPWDTIALLEGAILGLMFLAYWELSMDPRLAQREADYVHPVILWPFKLSLVLVYVWIVSIVLVRYFGLRLVNTTILFDVVCFLLDVTGLGVVVSLVRVLLRLNHNARSHQDARP